MPYIVLLTTFRDASTVTTLEDRFFQPSEDGFIPGADSPIPATIISQSGGATGYKFYNKYALVSLT